MGLGRLRDGGQGAEQQAAVASCTRIGRRCSRGAAARQSRLEEARGCAGARRPKPAAGPCLAAAPLTWAISPQKAHSRSMCSGTPTSTSWKTAEMKNTARPAPVGVNPGWLGWWLKAGGGREASRRGPAWHGGATLPCTAPPHASSTLASSWPALCHSLWQ